MPPKSSPPPPAADQEEARDASSTDISIGAPRDAPGFASHEAEQALGDAVFSLMGVPFDKLEEQLQELK